MTQRPVFVGIDLGTTNSTAAVFDGETLSVVRNRQGSTLTPSIVRIDARGNVTVGERARRFLDSDPHNTRAEFKRLMGTDQELEFPAAKLSRRPQALAAEVLKALRQDVMDQAGVLPERAVVSVPALFELPQVAATSEAARLAGFERIEVIQEPVASAIAAGWSADEPGRDWLVYDLGGGTFDVSLLQTQEGLLRVVGHDGDNFLGGRDFDAAIVTHVLAELAERGIRVDRADPAHAVALRRLRFAAEEAKIELTRAEEAAIVVPACFTVGGAAVDVETWIDRPTFAGLVLPLIDRSITVCLRLVRAHGMAPADLDRVVLVGGPTLMPLLRDRVAAALGPVGEGMDPMLLVARGAALYAATAGLDACAAAPQPSKAGPRAWLQHPAVSSDPQPFVVGRILDRGEIRAVQVSRADGGWRSGVEALDAEGAFALPLALLPRRANEFHLQGLGPGEAPIDVHPPTFRIVHGLTIGDPPLARSIGVALADDTVRTYFERGSPLPMRRTFTHQAVETLSRGDAAFALRVPIVQGEFGLAHLCRLVGSIAIPGDQVRAALPAGSDIEITLELDRGGRLAARAFVPALEQSFEQVAHLVVPSLDASALEATWTALSTRAGAVQADAFRRAAVQDIESLGEARRMLAEAEVDLAAARGGDADAGEKVRRSLIEVDAMLADLEGAQAWPAAEEHARWMVSLAAGWIGRYGDETERRLFQDGAARVEQLLTARKAGELHRQVGSIERLMEACYFRWPGAWGAQLDHAAGRVSEASDLKAATAAVRDGRAALARRDMAGVERAVRELWRLLPPDVEERRLGHDSGVR